MSSISELLPIPQLQAAIRVQKIVWWVSLFAIIIAILLIIMSIYLYAKGNKSAGTGLLITGGIIGVIAGSANYYTGKSTDDIIMDRVRSGPAGKLLQSVSNVFGKGEDFEETVVDSDCGCATKGGDSEEFEEDVNELDFVESSDEDDENPYDDTAEDNINVDSENKSVDEIKELLEKSESQELSESDIQIIVELYKKLNESNKKIVDDLMDKHSSPDINKIKSMLI